MHNAPGHAITPVLEQAFDRQRAVYPDDTPALDRLYRYLETTRPMLVDIKAAVCEFYGYEPAEITTRHRQQHAVMARQVFCYIAYRQTRWGLKHIGLQVGLTNHTTTLHAIRRIEAMLLKGHIVRDDLDLLMLRISEKTLARRRAWS